MQALQPEVVSCHKEGVANKRCEAVCQRECVFCVYVCGVCTNSCVGLLVVVVCIGLCGTQKEFKRVLLDIGMNIFVKNMKMYRNVRSAIVWSVCKYVSVYILHGGVHCVSLSRQH